MFLLLRSKKQKNIHERLSNILSDPVYDILREKQPQFADKIVAVDGNVADIRLGLNDEDWKNITHEVDIIFHAAAIVNFDEPLRSATLTNVRGTRETLTLARACSNLKSYVYLSTAYVSATKDSIGTEIYEKFNTSPVTPETLISIAEQFDEDQLGSMTNNFINGWPNTYTFTKTVAEEQIRTTGTNLPICIVRPPLVLPAYYDPLPGWLDTSAIAGASGIILAVSLGVLHTYRVDTNIKLAGTPLDFVNNAVIAAGWDAQQTRNTGDTDIPIYTVSNKDYFFYWHKLANLMRKNFNLSSDKAIYLCSLIECKNQQLYWLLSLVLHYIPAYILDIVCAVTGIRPKGIKSFVDIFKKIDKLGLVYHFFLSNEWNFRDDNVKAMLGRMSDADKAIYNCDLSTINFSEYLLIWCVGIRKYIIKDGLKHTEYAYKKQKFFKVLNYVLMTVYAYLLFCILCFGFNFVKYVLQLIF